MSEISVVIPVYENPEVLSIVLYGYTKQSDPEFTLYVVNDGGDEALEAVVDSYRDRLSIDYQYLHPKTTDYRISMARNRGIRQVTTPRFICMDSDIVPYPNLIALHKEYGEQQIVVVGLRKHISIAGTQELVSSLDVFFENAASYPHAYCDFLEYYTWRDDERYEYSEQTEWKRLRHRMFMVATRPGKKLPEICYGHGLGFPTATVKKIGGFWEEMVGYGWEDVELVTRLCKLGCTTYVDPRISGYHLGHPEVSSKEHERKKKENAERLAESSKLKYLLRNGEPL